jgi:hypothetical protein
MTVDEIIKEFKKLQLPSRSRFKRFQF